MNKLNNLTMSIMLITSGMSTPGMVFADPPEGGPGGGRDCTTQHNEFSIDFQATWETPSGSVSGHLDLGAALDAVVDVAKGFWNWFTGNGGGSDGGGGGDGGDGGGDTGGGDSGGDSGGGDSGGGTEGGESGGDSSQGQRSISGASGSSENQVCQSGRKHLQNLPSGKYSYNNSMLTVGLKNDPSFTLHSVTIKKPIPLVPKAKKEFGLQGKWYFKPGIYLVSNQKIAFELMKK